MHGGVDLGFAAVSLHQDVGCAVHVEVGDRHRFPRRHCQGISNSPSALRLPGTIFGNHISRRVFSVGQRPASVEHVSVYAEVVVVVAGRDEAPVTINVHLLASNLNTGCKVFNLDIDNLHGKAKVCLACHK